MNWLAHLFLSEPSASFRIGNLLPDVLRPGELAALPSKFHPGIERHRLIDAFTDSHEIVKRSIARVGPTHRRFGGILVDIFYDHFLSTDWEQYSNVPLRTFTADTYASFEKFPTELPAEAFSRLQQIANDNWLCSYGSMEELRVVLDRLGRRLRKPTSLAGSVRILEANYREFRDDFAQFFPELVAHVAIEDTRRSN